MSKQADYVSIKEAADAMSVSVSTVYRMIDRGIFSNHVFGECCRRIKRSELSQYIEQSKAVKTGRP